MSFKKKIGIGVCVLLLLIAAGFAAVFGFAKYFTAQENAVHRLGGGRGAPAGPG